MVDASIAENKTGLSPEMPLVPMSCSNFSEWKAEPDGLNIAHKLLDSLNNETFAYKSS